MDLILCHQTADFDALGAAVGLTKLHPGAKIVLTGGAHPSVRKFLALHRDELALMEFRSVNPALIRHLFIVDTQRRDRIGKAVEWLELDNVKSVTIYDHHEENGQISADNFLKYIEKVGSCSTIICELLQQKSIGLNSVEATAMALGIHVDTGSLTFEQTTPRDALALAWLMTQDVNIRTLGEYVEPSLAPALRKLLPHALKSIQSLTVNGYTISWLLVETPHFIPGLSNLTSRIIDLVETDVLLFGHYYGHNVEKQKQGKLTIIGRSSLESVNLAQIFTAFTGGGHSSAASFTLRCPNPHDIIEQLLTQIENQIPSPLTARDLMAYPVRTIRPYTTIEEAQRILLRYGHSGLVVVNKEKELVGVISRRDIDLALHHGFSHAPVKGYMTKNVQVINPETALSEIEELMVKNDIGRLPVMENGQLIGIVTRTDVLRHLHSARLNSHPNSSNNLPLVSCLLPSLEKKLHPPIWKLLQQTATYAQQQGWHLYLVGGGVRDLLLTDNHTTLNLQDIDLVVDGFHRATTPEAGVKLAEALQAIYPQSRLSIHGQFQTAALLWHKDPQLGSLWLDIATARTEFYPYPAANPEVESSSIRQDLYRRDFTINALAVRLTQPHQGELLDFFGGVEDVRSHFIRVLHPNSFIEDPTRIYRAVRFAVRLNFDIETQTREYIDYAVNSGVFERVSLEKNSIPALTTRLKAELTYILQAQYWQPALKLLQEVGALRCLHHNCQITPNLWWQIRCLDRWLKYYHADSYNPSVSSWLLRLEIILSSFPEGVIVANNLELPKESIQRLSHLSENNEKIKHYLPTCQNISEKVEFLANYQSITLLLIAVKNSKPIRRTIWNYLMHWSKVKSPLDGKDLQKLGYKPSKLYKEILNKVLALYLDGKIKSQREAENFVLKNYPMNN
ncbi:CBS domain-containing protein [Cyanobacterium aponinum UTEX 3222]|uniref:CBS domain-containing protein n=1 Tax=Cyanobacterium aponinum TaxID=379064 RepID=UPI003088997F|nr:CBS domain-containing protein [Cyanobacterium aponinum UTEX 3222]